MTHDTMRKSLMDEAQQLLNSGKVEEANAKMQEIKDLDKKWDDIAQAKADLDALHNDPAPMFKLDGTKFGEESSDSETALEKAWNSDDYKFAWAKKMMGKALSTEENRVYTMVNEAYSHSTGNTSIVIPKSVTRGIWEMAGEFFPYFADVTKSYVNGVLSMVQEDTSSEAGWYEEKVETEDGKETFKEFQLSGCELSRSITVTWKLKEMAMEDFIPYIQRKMAKKMGAAAGYGVTHGVGSKTSGSKPEPMGTVTALLEEKDEPQVVRYKKGTVPTYEEITRTRAKIKSGYGAGLSIYANSNTIWQKLANIVDKNGRPMFVPDVTNSGTFRILGMIVKEDDSMKDGEVLMSNPGSGYHMNINKETTVMTEDHVKERVTDYCGYAIMDGNILTSKAHALLTEEEEEQE